MIVERREHQIYELRERKFFFSFRVCIDILSRYEKIFKHGFKKSYNTNNGAMKW